MEAGHPSAPTPEAFVLLYTFVRELGSEGEERSDMQPIEPVLHQHGGCSGRRRRRLPVHLVRNTSTSIIPRVVEFPEWQSLFAQAGLAHLDTTKRPMTSSMRGIIKAEGVVNATKVMARMMTRPQVRKRMMTVRATFGKYDDYLGYGISHYRK